MVSIFKHMGMVTPAIMYLPAQSQHWCTPSIFQNDGVMPIFVNSRFILESGTPWNTTLWERNYLRGFQVQIMGLSPWVFFTWVCASSEVLAICRWDQFILLFIIIFRLDEWW